MVRDADGDGFKETVTLFKNGKTSLQTQDNNKEIERHKKYPDAARTRHIEGRVTIRFVITPEGDARVVEVANTSGHKALDTAALKAVKAAAPFPRPPMRLFNGEVPLELAIVFELT